jgi:serine/threonine protein kinase
LQQQGKFSEKKIKQLLNDLLPVLEFCHGQKVIHRDIKLENIIRDKNGKLVLIDFGVSTVVLPFGLSVLLQSGLSQPG